MLINIPKIKKAKQVFLPQAKSLLLTQGFYLFGIVTTLAVLHLSIVSNHPNQNQELSFYALGWVGIILLLKRNRQYDESIAWFSSLLGILLLFFIIIRPLNLWNLDLILFRFGPIVAALGVVLLAFGFPGLQRQWRSFLVLCLMVYPYGLGNDILEDRLHIGHVTTVGSAFLLHYIGFKATYHDILLALPTGQVEVLYFCTGALLIVWLLKLSLLLMLVIYRLTFWQRLGLVLCAIGTGFFIGCIRVALLVLVVNNHSLFEYWHGSVGGQIFLAAATLTYVVLCNWLLPSKGLYSTKKHSETSPCAPLLQGEGSSTPPFPSREGGLGGLGLQRWRLPLLATTWIGVLFAAIYLTVNKQLLPADTFPGTLSLNSWEQVSATSLKKNKSDTVTIPSDERVLLGKQYRYIKNNHQLQIQMLYATDIFDQPNPFLSQQTKNSDRDSQKNIKKLNGIGYYQLRIEEQQAYLTACINPRGGSTVTLDQFIHNRYTDDFTLNRILPWLLGKEVLKDNRCIWVQLSTPLNSVTATDAYQILESVWAANYSRWQTRFPPLF